MACNQFYTGNEFKIRECVSSSIHRLLTDVSASSMKTIRYLYCAIHQSECVSGRRVPGWTFFGRSQHILLYGQLDSMHMHDVNKETRFDVVMLGNDENSHGNVNNEI